MVASGLCFSSGDTPLLKQISLRIEHPGLSMILGPNGAGKTLFLKLCHGLLEATSGTITWNGKSAEDTRHGQAMVFQRPVLLRRSVADNIAYALGVRGIPRRERPALVTSALQRARLLPLARRSAQLLSVGEQQRLSLARAWALKPRVLLLDEPCASLDPGATLEVERMVAAIGAGGTKVIMTTHDLAQAHRLADEIVFFWQGQVLEQGPAEHFFAGPQCVEAQAFINGELAPG